MYGAALILMDIFAESQRILANENLASPSKQAGNDTLDGVRVDHNDISMTLRRRGSTGRSKPSLQPGQSLHGYGASDRHGYDPHFQDIFSNKPARKSPAKFQPLNRHSPTGLFKPNVQPVQSLNGHGASDRPVYNPHLDDRFLDTPARKAAVKVQPLNRPSPKGRSKPILQPVQSLHGHGASDIHGYNPHLEDVFVDTPARTLPAKVQPLNQRSPTDLSKPNLKPGESLHSSDRHGHDPHSKDNFLIDTLIRTPPAKVQLEKAKPEEVKPAKRCAHCENRKTPDTPVEAKPAKSCAHCENRKTPKIDTPKKLQAKASVDEKVKPSSARSTEARPPKRPAPEPLSEPMMIESVKKAKIEKSPCPGLGPVITPERALAKEMIRKLSLLPIPARFRAPPPSSLPPPYNNQCAVTTGPTQAIVITETAAVAGSSPDVATNTPKKVTKEILGDVGADGNVLAEGHKRVRKSPTRLE